MANLRDIRNRITSVNNTQQITKAMKMVAAAKLRKAQDRIIQTRPYANTLASVIGRLIQGQELIYPLLRETSEPKRSLFIVVGSDRGLCGGFNNNLFKEIELFVANNFENGKEAEGLSLITIGKKATTHFSKRSYSVDAKYPGFFDQLEYELSTSLMNDIMENFIKENIDEVYLAYNEFKSVITQNRKVEKILPLKAEDLVVADTYKAVQLDYIYEPDQESIINELLPKYIEMHFWKAILESNASEQGARMTAMDSATENAKDLERNLRLKYNQARQSAITTEISEIVSGAQALSDS
ncbi:MAG: ATP synthase F1 subunit gamma [Balneola sp.]|mgnify:CR=1 FL=1|nr:ATP synthase F1 subunit gamma [Balneola sp.]|tara:strand:- start:9285 stop:10175 length:891 start_codon:yes stop_codon:yes gene_type:complete